MKIILLILNLILCSLLFSGCSEKKDSILARRVQKDTGTLKILNESGFIGATVAGTSIEHVLTLESAGGLKLENISVTLTTSDPISYKGGTFPGTGGTCGATLDTGETCTIIFMYEPIDTNGHTATLLFTYNDVLSTHSLSYVLSADSHPILSFAYGSLYDFGNKFVGSSTDLTIRISNIGYVNAENITINNLSAPFSFKGGTYPGTGGSCGSRIVIGQSCNIIVKYAPTNSGEHLQDITLNYLNTGRPEQNTLNLTAWGFHPAQLTISNSPGYDFGDVPSSNANEKVFTVTHASGDVSATSLKVMNLASPFAYKGGTFPGTGGTCQSTLTRETGSCTIILVLNSAVSGTWTKTVSFSYLNGLSTVNVNRVLTGRTKLRPTLSITTTGLNDFGIVHTGSTLAKTFTVNYVSGEMPATALGITNLPAPFSYTGGTFPGTGGTCTNSLSSGSCTIKVSFSPTTQSNWLQSTYFTYYNAVTTVLSPLITLKGITESRFTVTPTTLAFGNVVSGLTKKLSLQLVFQGGSPVTLLGMDTLTGPFAFSGGSFPGTNGSCNATFSAGSCTLELSFTPPGLGPHAGILTLEYFDGVNNRTMPINLTGTGTPVSLLTMSNVNYGTTSVNSDTESIITVSNATAMHAQSISSISFPAGFNFKGGAYPGLGGTCSQVINPTSSCNLVVVFHPVAAIAYSGTFSFSYDNGAATNTVSSTLTGTGINTSNLYISNFDTVNFSPPVPPFYVGQQNDISFTLSHGGSATSATGITKSLSNSTDYVIINDTCPASLVNGASCTFTLRFAPQSAGTKNASFQVNYFDGAAKTATRLLTGFSVAPALLAITPAPHDFGNQPTDTFYEQTFTVTRTGSISATGLSGLTTGSGFTYKGGSYPGTGGTCLSTLSGASCTIVGRFTPTATIAYSGQLGIQYYNGFQFVQSYVNLTGSGKPTGVLTYSLATYDFGSIIQTQTVTKTVTVTHSGPVDVTAIAPVALVAPYSFKGGSYPGTGGTCSTSLTTGSCTMVIDFSPTTTGLKNQTLTLNYNNGTLVKQINTTLTGTSLAQAIINISENNPFDFGTTNINGSIDRLFVLSNGGSVSGTGLSGTFDSAGFSFKGGSFPGTGGNCGAVLTSGSSCNIVLSFRPTLAMNYTANFTLNYHDGLRVQGEIKGLKGRGSGSMNSAYYLSLIDQKEFYFDENQEEEIKIFQLEDINKNGSEDELVVENRKIYKAVDGANYRTIFTMQNHFKRPIYFALGAIKLAKDLNQDGQDDLLIGIYRRDNDHMQLTGYDIICSRTGKVIERFLASKMLK